MTNMEITVSGIAMAEEHSMQHQPPIFRRPRTSEDFFLFCTYVLEYENYPAKSVEEARISSNSSPPLDSSGNSVNSESSTGSSSSIQDEKPSADEETDDDASDSYNNISCFCGKPFAGRPMIECSLCFTWIHLSCAKIKKSNIPDVFHCAMCKGSDRKRRSESPLDKNLKRSKRTT